jgi:hypothetical protein
MALPPAYLSSGEKKVLSSHAEMWPWDQVYTTSSLQHSILPPYQQYMLKFLDRDFHIEIPLSSATLVCNSDCADEVA